MKKAKIMLSAIAVVGIVGGALAFHSAKYLASTYFIPNPANSNFCDKTVSDPNYQTLPNDLATTTVSPAVLTSQEATCTNSTIVLYSFDE